MPNGRVSICGGLTPYAFGPDHVTLGPGDPFDSGSEQLLAPNTYWQSVSLHYAFPGTPSCCDPLAHVPRRIPAVCSHQPDPSRQGQRKGPMLQLRSVPPWACRMFPAHIPQHTVSWSICTYGDPAKSAGGWLGGKGARTCPLQPPKVLAASLQAVGVWRVCGAGGGTRRR